MKIISYSKAPSLEQAQFTLSPPLFFLVLLSLIVGMFLTNHFAYAQSKTADARASHLKEVWDLQQIAALSKQKNLPIMFMFGAEYCEYCKLLIEEVLEPMALSGLYDEKVVIMRHVGIDDPKPIPDWNGNLIKKSQWAYQLNADLTPTVLFMDSTGKEVASRIIGVSEITLYAGLIHQNINTAYQNMGREQSIPATPELLYLQTNENARAK